MLKLWIKLFLFITLFFSLGEASFIQSPIPPSSKQNFYRDSDGDGHMDLIEIRFLGSVSKEYLNEMLDSLVFDWIDSNGVKMNYTILGNQMRIDSLNPKIVLIDLSTKSQEFLSLTSKVRMDYAGVVFGKATLFISDSIEYSINIRDGMAPSISYAHLKSYKGKKTDTLKINFTENVEFIEGCDAYIEFKGYKDSTIRILPTSFIHSDFWMTEVTLSIPDNITNEERLSTRDSIRLLNGCVKDSLKNIVSNQSKFFPIIGYYPFETKFPLSIVNDYNDKKNMPIFQIEFENAEKEVSDSVWRISLDVMGNEFENALRESLDLKEDIELNPSRILFKFAVKIYTNLGSYVVGTKMSVKGNDSRLEYSSTRLSLRWNLMDGMHRRVSTGAYIANIIVTIEYDGKVAYRSNSVENNSSRIFGVKR